MGFDWAIWINKWAKKLLYGAIALLLAVVIAAVTELKAHPDLPVWLAALAQAIFIILTQAANAWKHTHG